MHWWFHIGFAWYVLIGYLTIATGSEIATGSLVWIKKCRRFDTRRRTSTPLRRSEIAVARRWPGRSLRPARRLAACVIGPLASRATTRSSRSGRRVRVRHPDTDHIWSPVVSCGDCLAAGSGHSDSNQHVREVRLGGAGGNLAERHAHRLHSPVTASRYG